MGETLVAILQQRFENNMSRHLGLTWPDVAAKLTPATLAALEAMERTGGEPDVVVLGGEICFVDCAPESPKGRRSCCYDHEAHISRKEHPPKINAMDLAAEIGIEMLDEAEYRELQKLGPIDTKTSSWLKTPDDIRALEGGIFGDYRYGTVFVYHNGVQSYYASRGFRGKLVME